MSDLQNVTVMALGYCSLDLLVFVESSTWIDEMEEWEDGEDSVDMRELLTDSNSLIEDELSFTFTISTSCCFSFMLVSTGMSHTGTVPLQVPA